MFVGTRDKLWKQEFESSQHDTVKSDNRVPTKHIYLMYIQHMCVYLSKTPRCFFSEFQTTSMQVASLTGVRQSGQSCWIWNADATHRAWYVCPHSSVSQACMCFPCEKVNHWSWGLDSSQRNFFTWLSMTINLKPLDQIQEFVASSHSMFPHSHDLWSLPSHGDIQATDSWKHLALFCSLRQTAQRSSLRSRLAESNMGVETIHNSTKIFADMWGLSSLSKGWKLLCAESKRTSSRRVKLPPIGSPPGAHSDFLSKRHYGRASSG